jgi:hypothetical protein
MAKELAGAAHAGLYFINDYQNARLISECHFTYRTR